MSCALCRYISQYALNWLNLVDHLGNTLLLGDPNETISARAARARKAGRVWAKYACMVLTGAARIVTLGKVTRDHCDYALDPTVLPNTREIWDWDRGVILPNPVVIIDDVEISK